MRNAPNSVSFYTDPLNNDGQCQRVKTYKRTSIKMSKSKPRGRPRKFDKDEVLQIIVNIFWQKGFAGTSLDDLSAATSLSRPSLYAAYGNKLAMYLLALEVFGKRMATEAVGAVMTGSNLRAGLENFYEAALDIYLGTTDEMGQGCLVFTTAVTEATTQPEIRKTLAAQLAGLDEALKSMIQARAPDLAPDLLEAATNLASGALLNLAIRARAGASRKTLRSVARSTADAVARLAA
jgi:TetR/AcrR family transcriptional regulator, copper-responsive repressor